MVTVRILLLRRTLVKISLLLVLLSRKIFREHNKQVLTTELDPINLMAWMFGPWSQREIENESCRK